MIPSTHFHQLTLKSSLKYGLHTERTILCACTNCPSAASVTSTRSSPCSSAWNPADKLLWKLFHRNENCSPSVSPIVCTSPTIKEQQISVQDKTCKYSQTLIQCPFTYDSHNAPKKASERKFPI
jgi:hypothetical protein